MAGLLHTICHQLSAQRCPPHDGGRKAVIVSDMVLTERIARPATWGRAHGGLWQACCTLAAAGSAHTSSAARHMAAGAGLSLRVTSH